MDVERYLQTLKGEQARLALASLLNPRSRDCFEFGLITGQVQAYERMQFLLEEQLAEAQGRKKPERKVVKAVNPYLEELDAAPTLPEQLSAIR